MTVSEAVKNAQDIRETTITARFVKSDRIINNVLVL